MTSVTSLAMYTGEPLLGEKVNHQCSNHSDCFPGYNNLIFGLLVHTSSMTNHIWCLIPKSLPFQHLLLSSFSPLVSAVLLSFSLLHGGHFFKVGPYSLLAFSAKSAMPMFSILSKCCSSTKRLPGKTVMNMNLTLFFNPSPANP